VEATSTSSPCAAGAVALVGLHAPVATGWADELIVDDADAAVQLSGAWEASATTPGFYGGGYLFHAPGHGTATIRLELPQFDGQF